MGVCGSTSKSPEDLRTEREAKIRNKWLEDLITADKTKSKDIIKLLFLGAGESGKSTLLKQMTIIHGKGFSDEEKRNYIPLIHSNILGSIRTLVKQSIEFAKKDPIYNISPDNLPARACVMDMKFDDMLTDKSAQYILSLWKDPAIQRTYQRRSEFQLNDSTQYFFERLPALMSRDFLPTEQDILRARIRTTGIVEHRFEIEKNEFRMFDVGGQRNARKKWIHCFEGVTSVIFVAALSGYDEVLYEDPSTNKLLEALNLFEDICESKWFKNTSLILFLNKKDIFKEKIKTVPLNVCFPHFNGDNEYRECLKFIKEEFKARNHHAEKKIFTHFTTATDTGNIRRVFQYVKATILRVHLVDIGLLDPRTDLNQGYQSGDDLKDLDYDDDDGGGNQGD